MVWTPLWLAVHCLQVGLIVFWPSYDLANTHSWHPELVMKKRMKGASWMGKGQTFPTMCVEKDCALYLCDRTSLKNSVLCLSDHRLKSLSPTWDWWSVGGRGQSDSSSPPDHWPAAGGRRLRQPAVADQAVPTTGRHHELNTHYFNLMLIMC